MGVCCDQAIQRNHSVNWNAQDQMVDNDVLYGYAIQSIPVNPSSMTSYANSIFDDVVNAELYVFLLYNDNICDILLECDAQMFIIWRIFNVIEMFSHFFRNMLHESDQKEINEPNLI